MIYTYWNGLNTPQVMPEGCEVLVGSCWNRKYRDDTGFCTHTKYRWPATDLEKARLWMDLYGIEKLPEGYEVCGFGGDSGGRTYRLRATGNVSNANWQVYPVQLRRIEKEDESAPPPNVGEGWELCDEREAEEYSILMVEVDGRRYTDWHPMKDYGRCDGVTYRFRRRIQSVETVNKGYARPSKNKLIESARTIVENKGDCCGPSYVKCIDCPGHGSDGSCMWDSGHAECRMAKRLEHAKAYLAEHDSEKQSRLKRTFHVGDRVRISRNTANIPEGIAGDEAVVMATPPICIEGHYRIRTGFGRIFELPWQQLHKAEEKTNE